MDQTSAILNAIVERLTVQFGRQLWIELFPDQPHRYVLKHPAGAVLVAFSGSRFATSDASDAIVQDRNITVALTLVFRQMNGPAGAIAWLDRIRASLTGYTPPHCSIALAPTDEGFIGVIDHLWQYSQKYGTRATQMQIMGPEDGYPPTGEDI